MDTEKKECCDKSQAVEFFKLILKKLLIIFILCILFSIGLIIGISGVQLKTKINNRNNNLKIILPTPTTMLWSKNPNYQIEQNKYINNEWKSYSNYYNSFTFQYPNDWKIDTEDGMSSFRVIISQECEQLEKDCASLTITFNSDYRLDDINMLIRHDSDIQDRMPRAKFITKIGKEKTLGYIWSNYDDYCETTKNGVCLPMSSTYKIEHTGKLYTIDYNNKLSDYHQTINTSIKKKL